MKQKVFRCLLKNIPQLLIFRMNSGFLLCWQLLLLGFWLQ